MSYGNSYICRENAGDQHFNIADHCDADTQIATASHDGKTAYYDMQGVDFSAFTKWIFETWEIAEDVYGYDGFEDWAAACVDTANKSISW